MRNPLIPISARERSAAPVSSLPSPIAARLELISGARAVWILSLDTYSARVRIDTPPPLGVSALLKWEDQEHFTTVLAVADGECTLRFDRPIAQGLPNVTARPSHLPRAVAALDQMQTRKRRKALVLDHSANIDTSYEWVVRLGRRNAPIGLRSGLTIEEQMFFYRAPLAHIIERQRSIR